MFPCTSCGLCCPNISKIEELKNYDLGESDIRKPLTPNPSPQIDDIKFP
jgi:Fe-S-cluster containining protein